MKLNMDTELRFDHSQGSMSKALMTSSKRARILADIVLETKAEGLAMSEEIESIVLRCTVELDKVSIMDIITVTWLLGQIHGANKACSDCPFALMSELTDGQMLMVGQPKEGLVIDRNGEGEWEDD